MEGVKMKVTRTLHPIGQGAFYTEKFEYDGQQCNVVFDCGGTSSVIEERVKYYCDSLSKGLSCNGKDKKPTIDAVFISHFDNDHVNGLKTLLNKAEVKCIFLPLLNDDEVYALSLSFVEKLKERPLYGKLIKSAVNGTPLRDHINVVRIDKYNGGISDEQPYLLYDGQNEHTDSRIEIPSGTSIKLKNSTPWIFKTFNFGNAKGQREEQLKKALEKENITSLTDLVDKWQDTQYQENIRKCYESVSGSMNTNSMVTYSGLGKNDFTVTNCMTSKSCYWRNCSDINSFAPHKAGCMYFGDYEAKGKCKWKQYEDSFGYLIDLLHVQQVPHHGSRHNYNVKLNKPKKKMNFISAGIGNKYHHPHKRTLRKINKAKAPRIWINECSEPVVFEYDVSES